MNIFKKKISANTMGYVVCEIARKRADDIIIVFDKENINYSSKIVLQVYTFIYNFYIIENTLLKKYSEEKVNQVMTSAYEQFFKMSNEIFSNNEIEQIKIDISYTYIQLGEINYKNYSGGFDNLFNEIAKMFLNDVQLEDRTNFDAIEMFNMSLEVTRWYDLSYIFKEFTII